MFMKSEIKEYAVMINMKKYIAIKVKEVLTDAKEIIVEIPPKEDMGDYSVPCFELRNKSLKTPNEVANYIKDNFIDSNNYFNNISVIGPYVNFDINYDLLAGEVIKRIEDKKESYGSLNQGKSEELLIEHTSINPNAEPHMGRCRNSLIGDFMSNLYKFLGFNVEKHYFINDLGKKIALLVIGIEKYSLKTDDFSEILDVYVKINKDAQSDDSLKQKAFDYLELVENGDKEMIQKFKSITSKCVQGQMKIFAELDIHFDVFTHESDYVHNNQLESILEKIKNKGKLKEDEESRYYVDLSDYDIPTKAPVLILTRSNKTSLYPMKDIAYTIYKMELNDKNNFIVLGEDQMVYMQQISAVMDILGYKAPELISYGYVLLDGNKMGASAGNYVLVLDFINEIKKELTNSFKERELTIDEENLRILCNACIKFTMLNVAKQKGVNFNMETATSFTGESGIYILYSIVRINSILRNNDNKIINDKIKFDNVIEQQIIKDLYYFEELVNNLIVTKEPANLTKYIFNLTQKFSTFYEQVNITNEEDEELKSSRIRLLNCTKTVLTNALSILGIKTVDKM